jgi:hypothetical protein
MGSFLLILFILILIWIASPIIRVWRKVRQFQDEYTRTMNQSQQQGGSGTQQQEQGKSMAERYRKYSDTTAENVDFEELEGAMEETVDSEPQQGPSSRYQEEEISDAEFEELP